MYHIISYTMLEGWGLSFSSLYLGGSYYFVLIVIIVIILIFITTLAVFGPVWAEIGVIGSSLHSEGLYQGYNCEFHELFLDF